MSKSKLINSGSYGCVFYPKINCDKQKNKSNTNANSKSKKATKLLITDDTIKKEFEINKYIHNNIPEYYKWTIVWNDKCNSPNYQTLKKISEIDKCIDPKKKKKNLNLNNNTKFSLLQGLYGGKSSKYFMDKEFNKSVFNKQSLFNTQFIKLMKTCESLFLGISELSKNNLCHHDLNVRNILFNEDKFILIDYGLSFFLNDTESVLKRMNVEFFSDRIYESYPFEYLYYPKYNHKDIISEQEEIALNVHRNNYSEIYKFIHHDLFKRDTDNIRFEPQEIEKFRRILFDLIIQIRYINEDETKQDSVYGRARRRFFNFAQEYEKRRNKDFVKTFPELEHFYNICKLEQEKQNDE